MKNAKKNYLETLFVTEVLAVLALLAGQITYVEKLDIFGLQVNKFIFTAIFFSVLLGRGLYKSISTQLFSAIILVSIIITQAILLGIDALFYQKYLNLLVFVFATIFLVNSCHFSIDRLLKVMLFAVLLIAVVAMYQRYTDGTLGDREGKFFLFGPIVFSRLMFAGVLIAQILKLGPIKYIFATTLLVAGLMTYSKGPFIAFMLCQTILLFYQWRANIRLFCFLIFILSASQAFYGEVLLARFLDAMWQLETIALSGLDADTVLSSDSSSLSIRILMIVESWAVFKDHIFGVGLGNWANATKLYAMEYPHNIVAEIYVELGLVLGSIFIIILLRMARLRRETGILALYYFVNSLWSGDILDFRYVVFFLVVSGRHVKNKM